MMYFRTKFHSSFNSGQLFIAIETRSMGKKIRQPWSGYFAFVTKYCRNKTALLSLPRQKFAFSSYYCY
jgi:hypothetical protein